jgi:opacity protein-like surface antigen
MKSKLTIASLFVGTLAVSQAAVFSFDSDATVNAHTGPALGSSIQIGFGVQEDILDGFGSDTGRDRWVFELAPIDPITADPTSQGYSPGGSFLNAFNQTALISFGTDFNITSFSIVMDGSTFGVTSSVEFYNGNDDLITSLDAFGLVANYMVTGSNISGVSKIALPAGAFFDNMTLSGSAVPEPSAVMLLGLASLGFVTRRRRA